MNAGRCVRTLAITAAHLLDLGAAWVQQQQQPSLSRAYAAMALAAARRGALESRGLSAAFQQVR
jgi:hypothetical protein